MDASLHRWGQAMTTPSIEPQHTALVDWRINASYRRKVPSSTCRTFLARTKKGCIALDFVRHGRGPRAISKHSNDTREHAALARPRGEPCLMDARASQVVVRAWAECELNTDRTSGSWIPRIRSWDTDGS